MGRSDERVARGEKNDGLVTEAECARARIPDAPLPPPSQGIRLRAGGVKRLSLPTFFAAAKKVGAAPHSNALNLSPAASSEFVREMEVGLGFSGWSWIGARGLYPASGLVDHFQHTGEAVQTAPDAQKARAEDRLECAQCIHPVRTAGMSVAVRRIEIAEQCAQVVGEDFFAPKSCCNASNRHR